MPNKIALKFSLMLIALVSGGPGPATAGTSLLGDLLELSKSVVTVHAKSDFASTSKPRAFFDKKSGRFFTVRNVKPLTLENTGAGIIIDERGLIATNAHVTENKRKIAVTLHSGKTLGASFVGFWPDEDLAILRIDPPYALKAIPFADSDRVSLRDRVFSIGQSKFSKYSISEGTIKGIGTLKTPALDDPFKNHIIQMDFSVYQGDSGTPILDEAGGLVGMVTAKLAKSHKASYAIASNLIRRRLLGLSFQFR